MIPEVDSEAIILKFFLQVYGDEMRLDFDSFF